MKRLFFVAPLLLALMLFSSCSVELVTIEECEWKMSAIMTDSGDSLQNANDLVVAVGEPDEAYPDAEIMELTLSAQNGELRLTDVTNGIAYSGSYKVSRITLKSIEYEITIEGIEGYATVAQTKYYDGSETPTLPISMGEYALYFVPND